MNIRRRNPIEKGLKDYMVPIVGFVLILLLIFFMFSGDDSTTEKIDLENKVGLELQFDGAGTEAYIEYPGNYKKKVESEISLYKGEKVSVKEGSVTLSLLGLGDFKVNKLGELKYLENGNFALYSGDLWLNASAGTSVEMKFGNVKVGENSHISFSQNEMGSTVYLLNGFAEIENLVGESTVLAGGQKITVSRLDASNEEVDLSLLKENIDDYYKQSDWFIKNNGDNYLNINLVDEDVISTGSVIKQTISSSSLISFDNLSDEDNVSSDTINVTGEYSDENISKITLNGVSASINKNLKTFKFENVSVSEKENDLVFKVYDDANDILSRFVYTVYYAGGSSSTNSKFSVTTFDVDGSQFTFTDIKDSGITKALNGKTTYTTYGDFLTIYGLVSAKGVDSVSVNGFTLSSFNGSTWRYHPSVLNNNLEVGTNTYEVKYYGIDGKILYTNHFIIIKKELVEEKKVDSKISDEASIN